MADINVLATPQTIPDAAQPVQGIPGSRATFFLRSTPRVFTLLAAGQSNQDFQIAAVQPVELEQRALGSRTFTGSGSPDAVTGWVRLALTAEIVSRVPMTGAASLPLALTVRSGGSTGRVLEYVERTPAPVVDVAFADQPLTRFPTWSDLSPRLRRLSVTRGRSYEFDRMETGTLQATLDNRDAALNPENAGVLANCVTNPSFETGTAGWNVWAESGSVVLDREATTAGGAGSYAGYVSSILTTDGDAVAIDSDGYAPVSPVLGWVFFRVRARARSAVSPSNLIYVVMRYYDTDGSYLGQTTVVEQETSGSDWYTLSGLHVIPASPPGIVRVALQVYLYATTAGLTQLEIDGALITPLYGPGQPESHEIIQALVDDLGFSGYVDGSRSNSRWEGTAHASRSYLGGPYYPLVSTRPFRVQLLWGSVYPLFRGITEGYPQQYPSLGADALVEQQVNDLFYALNQARFTPGSTTLYWALAASPSGTSENVYVSTTGLPMPQQQPPFTITVGGVEEMEVTSIQGPYTYQVTRTADVPLDHPVGATVTAQVVSFGQAWSGWRIHEVLEALGFDASWYDLDGGQTIIATSGDLTGVNPLEHINLVVEAEFGRFFVSKAGKFTFRDRSSVILDSLDPVMTFSDGTLGQATDVPYVIEGALEHSEEKLYNRVKITTPSGFIADVSDTDSIADHFERVFEREWPYANDNDAIAAANFILMRSVEHSLRLPALSTAPARNPDVLWPLVLAREIGDRCRFYYKPDAGNAYDKEVVIEGIAHEIRPGDHRVRFQLTEADSNEYWILGTATYGELGQTSWVAF